MPDQAKDLTAAELWFACCEVIDYCAEPPLDEQIISLIEAQLAHHRATYQEWLAAHKSFVADLEAQLAEAKRVANESVSANERLAARTQELRVMNEAASQDCADVSRELHTARLRIADLEASEFTKLQRIADLEREFTTAREQLADISRHVTADVQAEADHETDVILALFAEAMAGHANNIGQLVSAKLREWMAAQRAHRISEEAIRKWLEKDGHLDESIEEALAQLRGDQSG